MTEHSVTAAAVAKEITNTQNREDRFLALPGQHLQLDLALLDIEDCICGISLREDDLPPTQLSHGFSGPDLGQKDLGIESRLRVTLHQSSSRNAAMVAIFTLNPGPRRV